MRIGVLALQGAVGPHLARLRALGVEALGVRTPEEWAGCQGLVLPGGESSTMLLLLERYGVLAPLRAFAQQHCVWGVCAGLILMATRVENPCQPSLGLLPIAARRNAYGRQNESFIAQATLQLPQAQPSSQEAVFIRAPEIISLGPGVRSLAEWQGQTIAAAWGRHMACTFHPELSPGQALHRYFLQRCQEQG